MNNTFLKHLCAFTLLIAAVTGIKTYNYANEICCRGKLYPQTNENGSWLSCCEDKVMVYHTHSINRTLNVSFCCDGEVHYSNNPSDDCCGKKLMNTVDCACFNGTEVVQIPPTKPRNGNTRVCGNSTDENEMVFYDQNEQECCNGVLYNRNVTDNGICYGGQYIDLISHATCFQFNRDTQQTEYIYVPLDGRDKYNTSCCNKQLYDHNKQICLYHTLFNKEEKITKQCCDYTYTYNANAYAWTAEPNEDGMVNDEDCHRISIGSAEVTCFRNRLITLADLKENHTICPYDLSFYDVNTQACCSGGVQDLLPEERQNQNCCEDVDKTLLYEIYEYK